MKNIIQNDLHLHTVACRHAAPTVYEIADEAKRKKMKIVGINEHGTDVGTDWIWFLAFRRLPRMINGVEFWKGGEADPSPNGKKIDIPSKAVDAFDYISLGMHSQFKGKEGQKEKAMITAIKKFNKIKFVVHPYTSTCGFDIEKVTQVACDNNVLMELNNSYFRNYINEYPDMEDKAKKMVKICKENKMPLIVNTDAHFLHEIGDVSAIAARMKMLGVKDKEIINLNEKRLREFFGVKC